MEKRKRGRVCLTQTERAREREKDTRCSLELSVYAAQIGDIKADVQGVHKKSCEIPWTDSADGHLERERGEGEERENKEITNLAPTVQQHSEKTEVRGQVHSSIEHSRNYSDIAGLSIALINPGIEPLCLLSLPRKNSNSPDI